jgi:hypothetical protein
MSGAMTMHSEQERCNGHRARLSGLIVPVGCVVLSVCLFSIAGEPDAPNNRQCVVGLQCDDATQQMCAHLSAGAACFVCDGDDISRVCIPWDGQRCVRISALDCGNRQNGTCTGGSCAGLVPDSHGCILDTCAG